ncbi:guanine nucleotide exchange protein SMCR8 [Seriola lalandi dorsalis]|uniref:Smith-Magenis syndrome chromosome region, candidate 8a n=1 Tax=Seriola lalandi dorsalis TaxID=1841481 RepID=A0A3B4Y4R6_SERLL|nr:guanine nucleotide exchange protein SMCR8 [Seriola lalandi dorsalis]XP_056258092.1 guanine nucleotide exchange protein smcr8a [Seriola aureovittata]
MIGSPDVVAFTKEDEYGQTSPDPWALPEEFSIPLHPLADSNPWAKTSYAKFTKDFILISEFSEQVGPQPLLTIPDDPKVCGTFDLNYFSLRIMSVDYQASFVGHPPGSGYPRLSFVEDSRVVLGDSKEGAFAYVHHLTLYDLEARGFVRPFCMAYVSADERKIMLQFQELSLRFSQASECLKAGNRRAFAKELQRKLRDLEYTHSVLQREEGLQREAGPQCMYSAHAVEKANELANVEKSIYEHRDLLRQISSYHCRPRRDPHAVTCQKCMTECLRECEALLDKYAKLANPFSYTDKGGKGEEGQVEGGEKEVEEDVKRRPSYTPQLIKAKSAKCFDKRLKTLQELCDQTFYGATVELLKETERSFRGDLCYLHTRRLDKTLRRRQRVTNFLFEEDLGDDDEDEGGTLRPFCAVNHAVDNYTLLSPPPIVLGPEPLKLDSLEPPDPLDPASETSHTQESELGLGESHLESSPSDQTLETQESSEETKGSFSSDKSGMGPAQKHESLASVRSEPPDPDSDLTLDPDHNADLERESSSEETTAGEDEGDQTPVSLLEVVSELEASREDDCERGSDGACEMESDLLVPMDTACCMAQEGFLYEASPPEADLHLGQSSHHQPSHTLVVNQEPQALLPLQDDYTVGSPCSESPAAGLELPVGLLGDAVSRTSVEDGSDCTMSASTGSDRAASPLGYGGVVTLRQRKKAGQGALRFVRQYPFAIQALWCLLSGRTLVVLGADEGRVRRLVAALALFVPGPGKCGERVQAWLSCPFTLTDLQRWKLVGLQRVASPVGSSMLYSLSRYSRYISILDADQKTLRCPPYRGQLLANVADHRTYIRRGSTYFLQVQSTLCRMAAKAFLFTFTHHLHLPVSSAEGPEVVEGRRRCFLQEQLGLGEEDSQILLYLSQLVTQQYLQPATGGSAAAAPCFSFNYTTSVLYKI